MRSRRRVRSPDSGSVSWAGDSSTHLCVQYSHSACPEPSACAEAPPAVRCGDEGGNEEREALQIDAMMLQQRDTEEAADAAAGRLAFTGCASTAHGDGAAVNDASEISPLA